MPFKDTQSHTFNINKKDARKFGVGVILATVNFGSLIMGGNIRIFGEKR